MRSLPDQHADDIRRAPSGLEPRAAERTNRWRCCSRPVARRSASTEGSCACVRPETSGPASSPVRKPLRALALHRIQRRAGSTRSRAPCHRPRPSSGRRRPWSTLFSANAPSSPFPLWVTRPDGLGHRPSASSEAGLRRFSSLQLPLVCVGGPRGRLRWGWRSGGVVLGGAEHWGVGCGGTSAWGGIGVPEGGADAGRRPDVSVSRSSDPVWRLSRRPAHRRRRVPCSGVRAHRASRPVGPSGTSGDRPGAPRWGARSTAAASVR